MGLSLRRVGRTSLSYQLGMFGPSRPDERLVCDMTHGYSQEELDGMLIGPRFEERASCVGRSVHVFVDPGNGNKPTPIPQQWTDVLNKIQTSSSSFLNVDIFARTQPRPINPRIPDVLRLHLHPWA